MRDHPDLAGVGVSRGRSVGAERGARERGLLVGREVEVAVLADFLVAGQSTPQALVLDGEAALLLEEVEGSAPEERAAIAFAVFQLLGERGGRPLLIAVIAVDDVRWLDAASASVLAFAVRRLAAARAAILVARRSSGGEAAPHGLDRAFRAGGRSAPLRTRRRGRTWSG
jgi:hypothetical protein